MATIRFEDATDIVIENITVQRKYVDDVLSAYRLTPNNGYVMYDTTAEDFEQPTPDSEPVPVIYYRRTATYPARLAPEIWKDRWVAVLETEVDENYIFGGGDNNEHEVM